MRRERSRRSGLGRSAPAWLLVGAAFAWAASLEAGDGSQAAAQAATGAAAPDEHAHHAVQSDLDHLRSLVPYDIPAVRLVDSSGSEVSLATELNGQGPLMLNFIFTTCTAVCPVQTATFSQVQAALGDQRNALRMVSISIDPEHDTPARLNAYAAKFHAGPQWRFLTGSLPDTIAVQKAFDAYRGEKASHVPLTFLHASPGAPWVRIEGFVSAGELMHEYRALVAR